MSNALSYSELAEMGREHVNFLTNNQYADLLAEAHMFGSPVLWTCAAVWCDSAVWQLPIPLLSLMGPLRPVPLGRA